MNLRQVRDLFIEATGRYDLVSEDLTTDAGANRFVNMGQHWLDDKQETPHSRNRHLVNLASGQFLAAIPNLRYVLGAWVSKGDGRTALEYLTEDTFMQNFQHLYGKLAIGATTLADGVQLPGTPIYYTRATSTVSPLLQALDVAVGDPTYYGTEGLAYGDSYAYTTLLVAPAPDEAITLVVDGAFYSREMSADTDTSYWSIAHPQLLAKAAAYSLECFYRNREGMQDWLMSMQDDLRGIDYNLADEAANQLGFIGGVR